MKINYPQNPFQRQYLLNKSQSPYLSSSTVSFPSSRMVNHQQHIYHSRAQHYPLNIWNFHDNHNSSFNLIKPSKNYNDISTFQKSMLLSNSRRSNNNNNYNGYAQRKQYATDQNPFHRKNLLISRQKIDQQIQKDFNKINYQSWTSNAQGSNYLGRRQSRNQSKRQSVYRNQYPERQSISPNDIDINGSLMMNLIDQQAIQKHMSGLLRGTSQNFDIKDQQTQPPLLLPGLNPQMIVTYVKDNNKDQITVRGRRFYKNKVISNVK